MAATTLAFETMTPAHLDGALALSSQAGWPHRREDWEFSLSISQGVVGLEGGRVVGTILMTPYGDDGATLNLVIVDKSMRGRGLGRRLMDEALALAGKRTCYLVATQVGLPLYEKLGFVATGEVVQCQGAALPIAAPAGVDWAVAADQPKLMALDRSAYGHERAELMQALQPVAKFAVIRDAGEVQSFAAIRKFGRGQVIGPVVARSDAEAKTLVDYLLSQNSGQFVRLDLYLDRGISPWLEGRGLATVGGGVAMRRAGMGQQDNITGHHRTYALVSQALG